MLKAGDRLGRFELRAELGRGSHGAVFEAVDVLLLGEKVAIKALQPFLAGDPTLRERFKRELVLTRRVSHPGVARLHDLHEENGVLFISMQFIEGRSLSQAIRAGIGSEDRVIRLLRGVCSALSAAHAEGVIHRDLKPANIMLADSGDRGERVVVLDFGIATATGVGQLTRPGEAMGSVPYVPPEVWAGQAATHKGDQYSLAVTAFVCLTKELPYTGKSPLEFLDAIKTTSPTIRERVADIDLELEAVILKAMAKLPEDRFSTIADLELAFRRVAERRASGGPPPRSPEAAQALLAPTAAPPPVELAAPSTSPGLVLSSSLEAELAGPSAEEIQQASRPFRVERTSSKPPTPVELQRTSSKPPTPVELPRTSSRPPTSVELPRTVSRPPTPVELPTASKPNPAIATAEPDLTDAPTGRLEVEPPTVESGAIALIPSTPFGGPQANEDSPLASGEGDEFSDQTDLVRVLGTRQRRPADADRSVIAPPPGRDRRVAPLVAITALVTMAVVLAVVASQRPAPVDVALAPAPENDLGTPEQPPPEPPLPLPPTPEPTPDPPAADDLDGVLDDPHDARPDRPTQPRRTSAALDAVAQAAARRGLRAGDVPAMDAALALGRKAAKASDKGGVDSAAKAAKAALDAAVVDKAFVSAKLARFNKAFDVVTAQKTKDALKPIAKDVMVQISRGAWTGANERLNDGFVVLSKARR